ncbi:MAG: acetyltransferase, partial [Phycisphaerales bacterium]
ARLGVMEVAGVFDDAASPRACGMLGVARLGGLREAGGGSPGPGLVLALGALPLRRSLIAGLPRDRLVSVVAPGGWAGVVPGASVGRGVFIAPGAVVQAFAAIADHAIINTGAIVEHDCRVGENAHIAPGAVIGGGAEVGADALIGLGARVMPGVRIGAACIIGAGAVVTSDVEAGRTAAGVPARVMQ